MAIVAAITPVVATAARWGSRMCCLSMLESAVAKGFVKSKSKSSSRCMSSYSLRIISTVATITAGSAAVILVVA
jgi:hypothetical protein